MQMLVQYHLLFSQTGFPALHANDLSRLQDRRLNVGILDGVAGDAMF